MTELLIILYILSVYFLEVENKEKTDRRKQAIFEPRGEIKIGNGDRAIHPRKSRSADVIMSRVSVTVD